MTGFQPEFGWIDLPVLDADGEPRHDRGVVAARIAAPKPAKVAAST